MRVVLQRVSSASVAVEGSVVGAIGLGVLLLVAVVPEDSERECSALVDKVCDLRIFSDRDGKMNVSLLDIGGEALVVSQFTLAGAIARGRRPSFSGAAIPEVAEPAIRMISEGFRSRGVETATGVFGANMDVELVNDGPVTFILDVADGRVR
ncbi:MAG: D-aminoacyl-tRNA deacylase [Acidimicrobiia bacterium]